MGTLAARTRDASQVYNAFFSLVVDDRYSDDRDIWSVCDVLNDAALKVGSSVEGVVTVVSRFAAKGRAQELLTWLGWPSDRKRLNGPMGYCVVETDQGIEYRLVDTFAAGVRDRLTMAERRGASGPQAKRQNW
jgi:hypothetical protein